ncbi:MAG: hypothetical protein AAFN74_07465 [Myxococcota bacterium]
MRTLGNSLNPLGPVDPRLGFNRPLDLLHQQFQAGQIGGPNLGGLNPDVVVQLQQLLISVLAPLLQNMLNASESFQRLGGPGAGGPGGGGLGGPGLGGAGAGGPGLGGPGLGGAAGNAGNAGQGGFGPVGGGQSFGGVNGFFRDVAAGLTNGQGTAGNAGPGGGYGTGGGYGPGGPGGGYGPGGPGGGYGPGGPGGGYGPGGPGGPGGEDPVGETIPSDLDYRDLSREQRRALSGMSDRERAVLHLWGIQMTSEGAQDGGVLLNVLQNPEQFQAAEVELARELQARDTAQYGGITGKALDQEFFSLYQGITGEDISGRYGNAPVRFADGPLDMDARLTGDNGLSGFENQVLQLWGHAPLFNNGQIDGNIVDYALNSDNALEANLNREDLLALREADLRSDGVLNGDSLENAFLDTLDHLYLGGPEASAERTMADALEEAALRRSGALPPIEDVPEYGDVTGPAPIERPGSTGGGQCPFLAGASV